MDNRILNLTQHMATQDQLDAGVVEPWLEEDNSKEFIQNYLTFQIIPTKEDMIERAKLLADIAIAHKVDKVMIGGAPFFMSILEMVLKANNITPLYAFSIRETIVESMVDGSVIKKNVFKHIGFVEV